MSICAVLQLAVEVVLVQVRARRRVVVQGLAAVARADLGRIRVKHVHLRKYSVPCENARVPLTVCEIP